MRTLNDVRRRAVPGTRLEVVAHTRRPELEGTIRTVVVATAAMCGAAAGRPPAPGLYLDFTSSHSGGQVYCGTWPATVRILGPDTFEYDLLPGVIRLRFLPPGEAQP